MWLQLVFLRLCHCVDGVLCVLFDVPFVFLDLSIHHVKGFLLWSDREKLRHVVLLACRGRTRNWKGVKKEATGGIRQEEGSQTEESNMINKPRKKRQKKNLMNLKNQTYVITKKKNHPPTHPSTHLSTQLQIARTTLPVPSSPLSRTCCLCSVGRSPPSWLPSSCARVPLPSPTWPSKRQSYRDRGAAQGGEPTGPVQERKEKKKTETNRTKRKHTEHCPLACHGTRLTLPSDEHSTSNNSCGVLEKKIHC